MSLSLPPDHRMIPGQTYVGKLPGDRRASFVRKRPNAYARRTTFSDFLGNVFAKPRTVLIPSASSKMGMRSWSRRAFVDSEDDYEYYPRKRRGDYIRRRSSAIPWASGSGRVAYNLTQTCSGCGKYRSPGWQARHPLIPGETPPPTLCKSCRDKNTSSEESECCPPRKKKKKCKHRHYHCSESEDEYVCAYAPPRPRYTHHHHYHHPCDSILSSPSRDSVKVIIDNGSESSAPKSRRVIREVVREPSMTTDEEVHVIRRVLSRQKSRSSISIEDVIERAPSRRRSTSSIKIVRSRSPDPPRRRYVEKVSLSPRRRRSRSGSHVTFTSDPDEVIVPRSRAESRRRRVFYDGADSGQSELLETVAADEFSQNALPGFSAAGEGCDGAAVSCLVSGSLGQNAFEVNDGEDIADPASRAGSASPEDIPSLQHQRSASTVAGFPPGFSHGNTSSCSRPSMYTDQCPDRSHDSLSEWTSLGDKKPQAPGEDNVSYSPFSTQQHSMRESDESISSNAISPSLLDSDFPDRLYHSSLMELPPRDSAPQSTTHSSYKINGDEENNTLLNSSSCSPPATPSNASDDLAPGAGGEGEDTADLDHGDVRDYECLGGDFRGSRFEDEERGMEGLEDVYQH